MIWATFCLWLWRGPDAMSTQPSIPGPTARTIHDVEIDLAAARYAQKRADITGRYANEVTRFDDDVNNLLDEWAWMHAGMDALDFPAEPVPLQPHGNLDAGCA